MNAFVSPQPSPLVAKTVQGFRINSHDRLSIENKPFRVLGTPGEWVHLQAEEGAGLVEQIEMSVLARRSAEGSIRHQPGHYLPDDLKPTAHVSDDFVLAHLPEGLRERIRVRHAIVQAVEELIAEGKIRNNDDDIKAQSDEIEKRAKAYYAVTCDRRALEEHEALKDGGKLRSSRGGHTRETIVLPSASTIRKAVANFRKFGMAGLADSLSKSGNRNGFFTPEETKLLADTVQVTYLTLERKTVNATVIDVARAFEKENRRRESEGLPPLRTPKRDAVRAHIKKLDKLAVMIARHGKAEAVKWMRPVFQGLEVSRPLERVEMDECKIDLRSILDSAQLHATFGSEWLEAVGLDGDKARWWLVLAIDVRTRVILGMKLTRDPKTSAAVECLRMVVSDKGQWSDAVGAMSPWYQAGVPETLVTDNGAAFKAWSFAKTATALGTTLLRTITGVPGMRGTGERIFLTTNIGLMERLFGRTFGSPKERGDYPSDERAILDADDLAFALVRWVVDIYHNSPHSGLSGRTPLEQWEADMREGNYPLHAMPDTRTKRLAFGLRLTRTLSKTGVTIMGVRYNTAALAAMFVSGGKRNADLRWDPENIGAIEVEVDGQWFEVPAVFDRFAGVNVHTWIRARRSLRARSAGRKAWNQQAVFSALDDIEAMDAHKSALFGLLDKPMTKEQFDNFERELFGSFEIDDTPTLAPAKDGYGHAIAPMSPASTDPKRTVSKRREKPATPSSTGTPGSAPSTPTSEPSMAHTSPTPSARAAAKFIIPSKKEPKE